MEATTGKNISGNSAKSSSSVIDRTVEGAHHTVDKIAGAAAPAIDRLAASAHQTVDRIAKTAVPAAGWIEGNAHKLNESTTKMYAEAKQYVRDHPFVALGAAVAVGVLIAQLARHRDHSAGE